MLPAKQPNECGKFASLQQVSLQVSELTLMDRGAFFLKKNTEKKKTLL